MTQTMNANKKMRGVDTSDTATGPILNPVMDEMVDINRYRFNGML